MLNRPTFGGHITLRLASFRFYFIKTKDCVWAEIGAKRSDHDMKSFNMYTYMFCPGRKVPPNAQSRHEWTRLATKLCGGGCSRNLVSMNIAKLIMTSLLQTCRIASVIVYKEKGDVISHPLFLCHFPTTSV